MKSALDLRLLLSIVALCALTARSGGADEAPDASPPDSSIEQEAASRPVLREDGLEALVPELSAHPYRMEPGVRPFRHRLSFSPGYGRLGSKELYTARIAYNPSSWLGYEWSIGHNPGESVHAALHMVSAIIRYPLPGRFQPYLVGGYGMMMVFPGRSLNADPVTKNAIAGGGGLEFYIRSDLAIRADLRQAVVIGSERDRDGLVAFNYLQQTIGLAFYRAILP